MEENSNPATDSDFRAQLSAIKSGLDALDRKFPGDDDIALIRKATQDLIDIVHRELSASQPADAAASMPAASRHILYIEDDPINFALIKHTLQQRPELNVTQAVTGESGLALAMTQNPSLILLDLNLPGVHGGEVLNQLQKNPTTAQIPVVVLSADATASQIDRLLAAGARNYLTKPFSLDTFLAVVDEVLEETVP